MTEIYFENGFTKYPNCIDDDTTLSFGAKYLIGKLISLSYNSKYNYNGWTAVSNSYLSSILNVSESQIKRLLKELKDKNYIQICVSRYKENGVLKAYRSIDINEKKLGIKHYSDYEYEYEEENEIEESEKEQEVKQETNNELDPELIKVYKELFK